ncbi:hypothetical protein M5689_012220 [Euphorbia peplus]|nr:hypothetical protein M5689_012220 [Euphorbia peplus]
MASLINFFPMTLLILLAISGQALSGRNVPDQSDNEDVKQPEFFLKSDRSFLIPGVGRVLLPPKFAHIPKKKLPDLSIPLKKLPHLSVPTYTPSAGTGRYAPGADDTFVPNPGFESPNPGRARSVPADAHP